MGDWLFVQEAVRERAEGIAGIFEAEIQGVCCVEFLGWFEDAECVYLAMEYVPLGDLEENVQAIGGTVKEAEVRDITIQILEGLKIMHLEKFAHRDLKPKVSCVCPAAFDSA